VRFRYSRVLAPDGKRWLRHGLFVEYAEDGAVLSEGHYANGKEQGLWKDFHPNGQLAALGQYEHGVEVGTWRYWDEQGNEEHAEQRGRGEA
jgi:antitoxin component YwqK of YwqJK toxin-antitoxin module